MNPDAPSRATRGQPPRYAERLVVPWWWWPIAVAGLTAFAELVFVFGPQFSIRAGPLAGVIAFLVAAAVATAFLGWLSAGRVRVVDGALVAGPRTLPAPNVGTATPLDAAQARYLLGRGARHDAVMYLRPWVHTAVRVEVARKSTPGTAPYWIVSTRSPAALALALAHSPAVPSSAPDAAQGAVAGAAPGAAADAVPGAVPDAAPSSGGPQRSPRRPEV